MLRRIGILATILALGTASANAASFLYLNDGITEVIVGDGDAADTQGFTNFVGFTGAIGSWNINVSTGISSPGLTSVQLNSVNQGGPGTLAVLFIETDLATTQDPLAWTASLGGTTNGSISIGACVGTGANNAANVGCDQGDGLIFGPGAFSSNALAGLFTGLPGSSYALKTGAVITHDDASDVTSFNITTTVPGGNDVPEVPEPTTMLLFSTALLGLGFMRRKKS